MIRPVTRADTPTLLSLTEATGVFKKHEIQALQEVLEEYHESNQGYGHVAVVDERQGRIVGYAYYAPASMTDRTWYLYWIAVAKETQAKGVGAGMLTHAEDDIRRKNGRVLFIETSSLPHYDLTRRFYLKHHYEVAGQLRDYYADGDDMVIFCKRLTEPKQ
ncbi:MAG TPA: GNAT family N-acetyltransferase, partial [Gemmataceae bacterium]|nr:GNAT family N-acetyltransferase [Gemmataceae bacterium]